MWKRYKMNCLIEDFLHQYEFKYAESGECIWVCKICGFWIHEFEDSQP